MKDKPNEGDPCFDNTSGVFRNLKGFTEQSKLDKYERRCSAVALYELELNPVCGNFDQAHLQAIHERIFEKVYPWAGELRTVNIARPASYPFTLIPFLQRELDRTFETLASEGHLKGFGTDMFVSRAGFYLGELNTLHSFRDGNGRAQREFFRELALEAGYRLNWSLVTQKQMYEASSLSHNLGKTTALAALIRAAIGRAGGGRLP
jgi:cell filamentation protein